MTTQALKTRFVRDIPEIDRVETETGDAGTPRGFDPENVPF